MNARPEHRACGNTLDCANSPRHYGYYRLTVAAWCTFAPVQHDHAIYKQPLYAPLI